MSIRQAFVAYVIGLCMDAIGGLFKILHVEGGDQILIVATVFKVTGGLIFIYKLLSNPKIKQLLD